MPTVSCGEVELSYERAGSGPPLLMIMGLGGTYSHWDERFLEDLRRDHEVIIYDHRGVGKSSRVEAPFTMSQLAADAAGLLEALGVAQAHVVGFSMGGMVAQELALSRPDLVSVLVLASTYCGGPGSQSAREGTMRRLAEPAARGDREGSVQAAWEVNTSPEFAKDEEAHARFMEIGAERRVALAVLGAQLRAISEHDTSVRLPSLKAPTLVIHGTTDAMVPVENGRMIARLVPGARLEILEGAGHLFFWEAPLPAATLVREHIAEHAPDLALQRADST
jgi:pimeloyl-ACP methyl ester carboxylesterase